MVEDDVKQASLTAIFEHITWAEKFEKRLLSKPCHIKQLQQGQGQETEAFWKLLGYTQKTKNTATKVQAHLDERFALFKKLGQARTDAGILPDMPNPISALPGFGGNQLPITQFFEFRFQ